MIENSLEKVREAENRAAKIIEDANQEKENIIAEAKKRALGIIEELEEQSRKDRAKLLEKLKKELEDEKSEKFETAEFSIKKLKADSKSKISGQVSFLYEKFLEAIE